MTLPQTFAARAFCDAPCRTPASHADVVLYFFGKRTREQRATTILRGVMNRTEALRILGLDEDATLADIKTAYKETAQILHPDRFATNKKLQDRATEQFKNLQEAYEYLTSGKGSRTKAGRAASATRAYGPGGQAEARLAGIAAARTQLVHQRDVVYDERRNGLVMAGIGAVVAILFRKPGPLLILATAGVTAVVWGIIQAVGAQRTIGTLNEHIDELKAEQRRLESELEDLE